jgi:hypothetical protein
VQVAAFAPFLYKDPAGLSEGETTKLRQQAGEFFMAYGYNESAFGSAEAAIEYLIEVLTTISQTLCVVSPERKLGTGGRREYHDSLRASGSSGGAPSSSENNKEQAAPHQMSQSNDATTVAASATTAATTAVATAAVAEASTTTTARAHSPASNTSSVQADPPPIAGMSGYDHTEIVAGLRYVAAHPEIVTASQHSLVGVFEVLTSISDDTSLSPRTKKRHSDQFNASVSRSLTFKRAKICLSLNDTNLHAQKQREDAVAAAVAAASCTAVPPVVTTTNGTEHAAAAAPVVATTNQP